MSPELNQLFHPAALVAFTREGARQAARLADLEPEIHCYVEQRFVDAFDDKSTITPFEGPLREHLPALMANYKQVVLFAAIGAVVRLLAPHLKDKKEDPGVVVIDNAGRFVIPVLSGHVGGANAYAEYLANRLQATPVVTTASETQGTLAVDILGRELGWQVIADKATLTRVSALTVNGEPVTIYQDAGPTDWWPATAPLPKNLRRVDSIEEIDLNKAQALLWISHQPIPEQIASALVGRIVSYRLPEEAKQ